MLVRREAVLLELEASGSYKTDAVPTVDDAIFADNVQWNNEPKMLERSGPKDTLGKRKQQFGGRTASLSFSCELKGSGTAGTAPEIAKALIACGMRETIVADTSVTYQPDTEADENGLRSCTIYYYQDGKLKKLLGARGQVTLEGSAQEYAKANFTFFGHPEVDSDAAIVDPNYLDLSPPQFVNASFSLGGTSLEISKLMVDLGNEISKPLSVNAQTGIGEIRINDRDVKGTIDPEAVLNATKNFYLEWEAGTAGVLDTGVVGANAGNRWRITAQRAYLRNINEGDRESIRTNDLELGFEETNGDDEISLIFT